MATATQERKRTTPKRSVTAVKEEENVVEATQVTMTPDAFAEMFASMISNPAMVEVVEKEIDKKLSEGDSPFEETIDRLETKLEMLAEENRSFFQKYITDPAKWVGRELKPAPMNREIAQWMIYGILAQDVAIVAGARMYEPAGEGLARLLHPTAS